jgi:hypothetical protein
LSELHDTIDALLDKALQQLAEIEPAWRELEDMVRPRPIAEYDEDMGQVLWWKFPIVEAPYVGSPLDVGISVQMIASGNERPSQPYQVGGWPGYHTHWTPIPQVKVP